MNRPSLVVRENPIVLLDDVDANRDDRCKLTGVPAISRHHTSKPATAEQPDPVANRPLTAIRVDGLC
jgi:hypothetical protein